MPFRNRGRNIFVHHKTKQNISVGFVRYHINISIHSKYIETFHYFLDTCIIKPLQIQYKTNVLLHDTYWSERVWKVTGSFSRRSYTKKLLECTFLTAKIWQGESRDTNQYKLQFICKDYTA